MSLAQRAGAIAIAGQACLIAALAFWLGDRLSWQSRFVIASLAVVLLLPLLAIIRSVSRKIHGQARTVAEQLQAQRRLNELNTSLRSSVLQAHRRGAEINERSMRRIGADLHDGPAQLIGLALLKLDELVPALKSASEGSARLTKHMPSSGRRSPMHCAKSATSPRAWRYPNSSACRSRPRWNWPPGPTSSARARW